VERGHRDADEIEPADEQRIVGGTYHAAQDNHYLALGRPTPENPTRHWERFVGSGLPADDPFPLDTSSSPILSGRFG
jgi:hypothetical protein